MRSAANREQSCCPRRRWPKSLHVHFHAHPGMDAAFEQVFPLGQTGDIEVTALKNSGPGHGDVLEAAGALRNGRLTIVEARYESSSELFHLSKSVWLTAFIGHGNDGPLSDRQSVGFEIPSWIGGSSCRFGEKIGERRRRSECYILAKVSAHRPRVVECGRITFVQRNNLGDARRVSLGGRVRRAG